MYAPGYAGPIPPMVSAFTKGIGWITEDVAAAAPASTTYEASQRAVYSPIVLPAACVVRRVWWANGATTTGGSTIEVGVYASSGYAPGALLVSGSATQGTASQVQFADVTDTTLPPGLYWIAITASSASNTTIFRSQISGGLLSVDAALRMEQATASPLPATATPVETTASDTAIYVCGFATTASP